MVAAKKKTAPRALRTKKPTGRASTVADTLALAAWAEADLALAQAMTELEEVKAARDRAAREDALSLLELALARAARKRGLASFGAVGAREPFDPSRHDLEGRPGKTVEIIAQGVARGDDILVRARVRKAP